MAGVYAPWRVWDLRAGFLQISRGGQISQFRICSDPVRLFWYQDFMGRDTTRSPPDRRKGTKTRDYSVITQLQADTVLVSCHISYTKTHVTVHLYPVAQSER